MTFQRWEFVARMLLGSFYLISGLNWIFGYISFLPHINMPPDLPIRLEVVAEMVKTGWLYQAAKVLEIVVGVSLLVKRFVPFTLVLTAPVAFITFMLGASLIVGDIGGWVTGSVPASTVISKILAGALGGLCVMLLHIWLMLCYFDYYRPMLTAQAAPKEITQGDRPMESATKPTRTSRGPAFMALGYIAMALQAYNLYLFVGMIGR